MKLAAPRSRQEAQRTTAKGIGMGLLVNGKWHDQWYDTDSTGGSFVRSDAQFRNWITPDGSAGPGGAAGFKAEAGRYHLYISLACPWASRVLIMRALKGLEQMISLSVRSEEHTSELQSLMRISYAVFCLKK